MIEPWSPFVTEKGPPGVSLQPSAGGSTGVATAPGSSADAFSAPHIFSGGYILDRALMASRIRGAFY